VKAAFQTLKEALCTAPILAYPKSRERFVDDTDASDIRIGRVLSHVQVGQERVTAYYSRMLNKVKRNYCITRQDLLAIMRALEHFHKYLYT
jgi:hypothetical protein